jgi:subtilisin family serine protease
MSRLHITYALLIGFVVVSVAGGAQQGPPPASVNRKADEVLIQFTTDATEADKADARESVSGRRQKLLRRKGERGELELTELQRGIPVDNAVALLSRHPAVVFAEPNWIYTHQATSNDPSYVSGALWGMLGAATTPTNRFGTGAGSAWAAGYTGSAASIVAVVDEGIDYSHPDLATNIWTNPYDPPDGIDNDGNGYVDDVHGWDFFNNDSTVFDGNSRNDVDAHGTHVSGTIGAAGGNGLGVVGVNWSVKIISAKFLGPLGGTLADAIKAIDYVTDLKLRHHVNLVATNNSWSGGGYSQALHEAIIRAAKADILFIAAAGNFGINNDTAVVYPANLSTLVGTSGATPASYDAIIAVAAIDSAGAKATFSDYGAINVDLGAPGVNVLSTLPGNTYGSYSGTSMATPHVTGAGALYAAMHPGVVATDLKTAILASAQNTPTTSLAGLTVTGGRLNIAWWVGGTAPDPPPPPPPPPVCGPKGCVVSQPPCGKLC